MPGAIQKRPTLALEDHVHDAALVLQPATAAARGNLEHVAQDGSDELARDIGMKVPLEQAKRGELFDGFCALNDGQCLGASGPSRVAPSENALEQAISRAHVSSTDSSNSSSMESDRLVRPCSWEYTMKRSRLARLRATPLGHGSPPM